MDRDTKRALLRQCKVDEPIPPDDPRHFDFDDPSTHLRGTAWREQVRNVIDLAGEPTAQLVTGLPGSGKSTELKRLQRGMEDGYTLVLADAGAWIRDDRPISPQDLQLALVLALYPDGAPTSKAGWLKEYADQVTRLFASKVVFEGVDAGAAGNNLRTRLTTDDTLFQKASQHLGEVQGLREKVFELLAGAGRRADQEGRPLVVVLDGTEKRATGNLLGPEDQERFRNHWAGAFLVHTRDLKPPVHVVYTVPAFLIRRAPELENLFGRKLLFLPMVRVFEREDGSDGRPRLHVPGVRAMREALFKRIPRDHFTSPAVASWLVVHSGGYFRDLLRLVNDTIYDCPEPGLIDRGLADRAIQRVRQTYHEGLEAQDEALLKTVHRARQFPLDEGNRRRMDGLLQSYIMMRYHNAESWYDAHPLLWPRLDVRGPSFEEVAAACP